MVGFCTNRVLRLFDKRLVRANRVLPEVIAIVSSREMPVRRSFKRSLRMFIKKKIIDILPDRRCKTIENYFKQCDTGRVQVVVMDLSKRFKDSVRRAVGNSLYETGYWALDMFVVKLKGN
ncbi:transposase [Bacillus smithii]|uniref:transposase n=1 Tax=Bacillus smithii TaxID=1479 RepID=UPI0030C910D0